MNIRARFVYHYKSNTISSKNSLSIITRTTQRKYQSTLHRHYKKHHDMLSYLTHIIARSFAACYRTLHLSLRGASRRAIVPHLCHCKELRNVLSYLTHVIARSFITCYRTSPMSLRGASRRGNLIKQHSTAKRYYLHFYIQKTAIRIAVFCYSILLYACQSRKSRAGAMLRITRLQQSLKG